MARPFFFLNESIIIYQGLIEPQLDKPLIVHSYTIYNEKYFSERQFSYIVRVLTWRALIRAELPLAIADMSWIRVLDTPSCYERGVIMWAERKSVRPLAPLVRIVDPCAQRRSASAHVHQRLASHGNHLCMYVYYLQDFVSDLRSS